MNNEESVNARGPVGTVVDAVADAVSRAIERLTMPKYEPDLLDKVAQLIPLLPSLVPMMAAVFKPLEATDPEGPAVKQVRREMAAEEARLQAEHAARLATLVADFGPKLLEAVVVDDQLRHAGASRDAAPTL